MAKNTKDTSWGGAHLFSSNFSGTVTTLTECCAEATELACYDYNSSRYLYF